MMNATTPTVTASMIWTGTSYLDLADPQPEAIHLDDICRALSRIPRYNGLGTRQPWTVGQHSLLCVELARQDGITDSQFLADLLAHDFTEAYIGDMVQPLKAMQPSFREVEDRVWRVIARKFGFSAIPSSFLKVYDILALSTEKHALIDHRAGPWPNLPPPRAMPVDLLGMVETETAFKLADSVGYLLALAA